VRQKQTKQLEESNRWSRTAWAVETKRGGKTPTLMAARENSRGQAGEKAGSQSRKNWPENEGVGLGKEIESGVKPWNREKMRRCSKRWRGAHSTLKTVEKIGKRNREEAKRPGG